MIEEELPDELENDLDDIEPVGDEFQLYEHYIPDGFIIYLYFGI